MLSRFDLPWTTGRLVASSAALYVRDAHPVWWSAGERSP
jgi:hypothetical protein